MTGHRGVAIIAGGPSWRSYASLQAEMFQYEFDAPHLLE